MNLFYMPGACSLAPHIALREAGLPFSLTEVDYRTRQTPDGSDYFGINPKQSVPALLLDNRELLTEVPVILQYIDGIAPNASLLPRPGMSRYRALEWLNFVGTEIHKSFSPLFRPTTPKAFLAPGRAHLVERLNFVEAHLNTHKFLMGPHLSVADIYLFTVCRWLDQQDMSLAGWPELHRHSIDIATRKAVQGSLASEGLAR